MSTSRKRERALSPQAAAPPPSERSDRERIAWLLAFLRCDIVAFRPRDVLALRNDVFPYLHEGDLATLVDFDPNVLRALGPVPPRRPDVTAPQVIEAARDLMAGLQAELRAGVDALQAGAWQPFAREQPAPHWSLERRADGTIRHIYMGGWRTITLASAAELLVRWWPHLRRCEYGACAAWFLPTHGRQRYHDLRCSAAVRYLRFKPTRNYKNEYARRYDSTRTPARRRSSGRKK